MKICLWSKLYYKIMLQLAKSFPLSKARNTALRNCGYSIGKQVYIGGGLGIAAGLGNPIYHLTIEDRVSLGPRVTLLLSSHPNYSKLTDMAPSLICRGRIIIKHDSWIGANAVIMPNITIGECSVVGAGAVVTKDVPPYTVVAGVPARIIKRIQLNDIE